MVILLTLLHSEQPKLHRVLDILSAIGLSSISAIGWAFPFLNLNNLILGTVLQRKNSNLLIKYLQ